MISASDALARLERGNRRFVTGNPEQRRTDLPSGEQQPFAIVLGCSDSRVPVEIVFDQDLGDLFVIRVAGNIVAPSQVGSVEFAASRFGVRLVVVLGHEGCGAVTAALDELRRPQDSRSPNLRFIVDRIRPSLESVLAEERIERDSEIIQRAVRANVLRSVAQLRQGSDILEDLIRHQGLEIVGARYSLASGEVSWITS